MRERVKRETEGAETNKHLLYNKGCKSNGIAENKIKIYRTTSLCNMFKQISFGSTLVSLEKLMMLVSLIPTVSQVMI